MRNHLFTHRGLNYEYQLHLPKLRFAKHFAGVRAFLEFLPRGIPEAVFEDGIRCSSAARECGPPRAADYPAFTVQAPNPIFHAKHNWLNAMCLQALRLARHNRERHPVVEGYFLSCDRNTIATEVPIWFYDKAQCQTFAGHIDMVQVNYGKLWVLDFKPNAAKERVEKVTRQLSLYAQGLAYRTGVKLSEIRCAWFDETDFYGFDPQWKVG